MPQRSMAIVMKLSMPTVGLLLVLVAGAAIVHRADRAELEQMRRELDGLRVPSAASSMSRTDNHPGAVSARFDRSEVMRTTNTEEGSPWPRMPPRAHTMPSLESSFAAEPEDPSWSEEAQRVAAARVKSLLSTSLKLGAVECRTSICRIDLRSTSRQELDRFNELALRDSDHWIWNGPSSVSIHGVRATNSLTETMYLAREGHDLPRAVP